MHGGSWCLALLFVGIVVLLEYTIRHALKAPGPNQWKWDRWDWLTLGIALVLALLAVLMHHCKKRDALIFVAKPASQVGQVLSPLSVSQSPELSYPPISPTMVPGKSLNPLESPLMVPATAPPAYTLQTPAPPLEAPTLSPTLQQVSPGSFPSPPSVASPMSPP